MIVLFHENVFIVIYLQIHRNTIKYHNFGAFVYDSAEKQMLNQSYWLLNNERTNLIGWQMSGFTHLLLCLARMTPASIYS
jgi:hypothetical protein